MVEFLNNNVTPISHIFYDLITTINFQHSKILDCSTKSRKCVNIARRTNFTSLILLTCNNLEPKVKRVKKFDRRALLLQKSTKNLHVRGKLLTLHFDTNNQFSIVFKPSEKSGTVKKIEDLQWNMASYGLPKVKIRYAYLFPHIS